jgi:5'-3' exonuclease
MSKINSTLEDDFVNLKVERLNEEKEKKEEERKEIFFDFEKHRNLYYSKKLSDKEIKDVCYEYFRGILFVLRYYLVSIPDYHWTYKFHKSPYFKELSEHINSISDNFIFTNNDPLTPFEQLLAVLPPKSCKLLPVQFRTLMLQKDSPIIEFYPEEFSVDIDGKKYEYEGHVILPFIDVSKLKENYQKIVNKFPLNEEEIKRNKIGKVGRYLLISNELHLKMF